MLIVQTHFTQTGPDRAEIIVGSVIIIGVAVLVYHITKPEKMKPPTQPVAVDNSQK